MNFSQTIRSAEPSNKKIPSKYKWDYKSNPKRSTIGAIRSEKNCVPSCWNQKVLLFLRCQKVYCSARFQSPRFSLEFDDLALDKK
jgi:hypothetical protein